MWNLLRATRFSLGKFWGFDLAINFHKNEYLIDYIPQDSSVFLEEIESQGHLDEFESPFWVNLRRALDKFEGTSAELKGTLGNFEEGH